MDKRTARHDNAYIYFFQKIRRLLTDNDDIVGPSNEDARPDLLDRLVEAQGRGMTGAGGEVPLAQGEKVKARGTSEDGGEQPGDVGSIAR